MPTRLPHTAATRHERNTSSINIGGGFNDSEQPSRIIGWAHPELIALFKYAGTSLFVDGTFRRARGQQRETIQLLRAIELPTESDDSSSDEDDEAMQDSDSGADSSSDHGAPTDAGEYAENEVTSAVV
ncbi:uncharacterized protein PITG_02638 [Phytophthora infestans T30-4]|uniref:Uncharacterized protein n=1 Tax=Phytophthora infestans (strain T30-4) TaxID=403677 RepID=D0MWU7_PHYIT|nr:uncharacterized protein PITG_02638 [Phytophthora infestans T30-4]EEY64110.1 hypothetical protein PITG_02638 [Phytophthora infestans T30-4]|eukprot:XP_002907546.1 hypothetical protein PITG_02638 [Phytophthora infestans T30-4]